MWPFKKKSTKQETPKPAFETILCIPGPWSSHEEFILSIVSATNGEYLAAGVAMMNTKEDWHCRFEVCPYDERMKNSFSYAGKVTRVTEDFLSEIDQHKTVVYLTGAAGDLQGAERVARAALAVLQAGGIGVKVETAGKAFMKEAWKEGLQNFEPSSLVKLFVLDSIVDEAGTVFSCGMQNLGYRDTIVSGEEFQYAVYLVSLFAYYQVVDEPVIKSNETFTPTEDSPVFRITEELQPPYKDDEMFGNPFGMWRLARE